MRCWTNKPLITGLLLVFLVPHTYAEAPSDANAPDEQGYFIALHGGTALPSDPNNLLKTGYSAGGEYGYRDDHYRTFVQMDYTQNTFHSPPSASYNLFDFILNLVYDFNDRGIVIPFVGGGAGYLDTWQNDCAGALSNCNFLKRGSRVAYQGVAGLGFRFCQIRLDLRYRYLSFFNANRFSESIPEVVLSYYFPTRKNID